MKPTPVQLRDNVGSAFPVDLSGIRNEPGFVYFIQSVHGGPVKIGWSRTEKGVTTRLKALQTACPWPLVVRATVPGPIELETTFQRKYAALRLTGEWFQPNEKLAEACGASLEPGPYSETELARVRWHLDEIRRRIVAGEPDLALFAAADADELAAGLQSTARSYIEDVAA